ncbi:class I SAM-dependent DNA methyltransferase [Primorskyibacter marinus]|uniref:class I SAM-dependent DNA methyltransferase n=1 Tax=Primorskyibacter marinus TaxID=1977320 RepID=UPI000E30601D|nr:DNA methyltransferase [Primorskyibacter marinus]
MNPVEIEQAISDLAEAPFDAAEFPYAFLEAFGRKATEIKKLRKGDTNRSDLGGVLQRNNIHIATCAPGEVSATLAALKASPATTRFKAKFILATDGQEFEAEDLIGGDTVACAYTDFPDHFGTFLPLAGISTVKQIRESAFDIKATGRLNRLYVELLKDNPAWGTTEKRHDMNHFMARLIFCFFAEDTDIFTSSDLFTNTIDRMSNRDGTNTHEVISEIFRAMNTANKDRGTAELPRWADAFPYVNGGLFSGSTEVPRFSKIAQRYLSHIGGLDWTKINPDIFGSMIQAVADEDERSVLGMHYTSVPNILKVLNPLFLDDLNAALEEAGDNRRKLGNLRARIAKIRVFDPACGSGNFLVIAYKELRAIEAVINQRRGEPDRKTDIPLTNYRGIELRDFSAEIARLALIIAEYQCDVTYRGQKEALAEFLPLDAQNWITCGNALRLDWLSICPPTGTGVKFQSEDLFQSPLDQAQIDFENEGGETYICGNPPFSGLTKQEKDQKDDLKILFTGTEFSASSVDYVAGWYFKAKLYCESQPCRFAFVSTNSMCQGQMIPKFWKPFLSGGMGIRFAHASFLWKNLAKNNAGVIVVIVGVDATPSGKRELFKDDVCTTSTYINPYLTTAEVSLVTDSRKPLHSLSDLVRGSIPNCGGNLVLSAEDARNLKCMYPTANHFLKRYVGAQEISKGIVRYTLSIEDRNLDDARKIPEIRRRIDAVREVRLQSSKENTRTVLADVPHRFELISSKGHAATVAVSRTTSENREFLATDLLPTGTVANDNAFFSEIDQLLIFAILVSRCHLAWIATVCGRMKNDYRYANTLGWNTFPVPKLTEKNREDLNRCAEDILLAREAHFPATIADLYNPETMPENLRAAHDRNDETLERIYIGRRFRNDTERLEKLFEMYTKMTTKVPA